MLEKLLSLHGLSAVGSIKFILMAWVHIVYGIFLPDASQEKKDGESDEGGKKEIAPGEPKSAKKKKKKAKEPQEKPNTSEVTPDGPEADNAGTGVEQPEEEGPAIDIKERLKKMASTKKKKSSKDIDSAAKAAAQEAAARSARLAAAKKKEKNHYNQQPVR